MKTCPICQNPMIADSAEYCPSCGQIFHDSRWILGKILRLLVGGAIGFLAAVGFLHLLVKH